MLTLAACATPAPVAAPEPGSLIPVSLADQPGWTSDDAAAALAGFRAGCASLQGAPGQTFLGGQGIAAAQGGRAAQWLGVCAAAARLPPGDQVAARSFFETAFNAYRIAGDASFTGYYDPEFPASVARSSAFPVPVYGRPLDLAMGPPPADPRMPRAVGRYAGGVLVPYFTRAQIMDGAMGAAARPLAWLQNPVDLLVLQIQGSGRLRLPDGRLLRLAFDGKNGRPYTPVGRVLIAQGALAPDQVSLQSIRDWLLAHPAQAPGVIARNESFVFFRLIADPAAAQAGPVGAMGVALTPGRSAAVDRAFLPLGAPVFADTIDPQDGSPWQHLLVAQDLGSAVGGAARADIFFGSGADAQSRAGRLHAGGSMTLLLPKPAPP